MKLGATILAGLFGTTGMTLFSYMVAYLEKENFKEPELLNLLIQRLPNNNTGQTHLMPGWVLHYTLGCLWAIVYSGSLDRLNKKPATKRALLFGLFGGTIGVYAWKFLFKWHPQPPQLSYTPFYRQLFIAHILFALFTSKVFAIQLEKEQEFTKR